MIGVYILEKKERMSKQEVLSESVFVPIMELIEVTSRLS
jgi:hypothetical protein